MKKRILNSFLAILVIVGVTIASFSKDTTSVKVIDPSGSWLSWASVDSVDYEIQWSFYNNLKFQWRIYTFSDSIDSDILVLAQGRWQIVENVFTLIYENGNVEQSIISMPNDSTLVLKDWKSKLYRKRRK